MNVPKRVNFAPVQILREKTILMVVDRLQLNQPDLTSALRSADVFSGIGGLALGAHQAGFQTSLLLEKCPRACELLERNLLLFSTQEYRPSIVNADIGELPIKPYLTGIDLLTGGPPCQPFSFGGIKQGAADQRNLFPEAIRLVREALPRAFLFENVKGLTMSANLRYLEYVELQLTFPFVTKGGRSWESHHLLLQSCARKNIDAVYDVHRVVSNAANHGVAQKRERVFLIGFHASVATTWVASQQTHCAELLAFEKWQTGQYWHEHQIRPQKANQAETKELLRALRTLEKRPEFFKLKRWRTVRDALQALPPPIHAFQPNERPDSFNHVLIPGARSYSGHTGSELDRPSKAIKAGNHGVAGGENMLRQLDGNVRYFTMREIAKMQSFPDSFELVGTRSTLTRQLGNAVPVCMGREVASTCFRALRKT